MSYTHRYTYIGRYINIWMMINEQNEEEKVKKKNEEDLVGVKEW